MNILRNYKKINLNTNKIPKLIMIKENKNWWRFGLKTTNIN
jgi:hypothetical protein